VTGWGERGCALASVCYFSRAQYYQSKTAPFPSDQTGRRIRLADRSTSRPSGAKLDPRRLLRVGPACTGVTDVTAISVSRHKRPTRRGVFTSEIFSDAKSTSYASSFAIECLDICAATCGRCPRPCATCSSRELISSSLMPARHCRLVLLPNLGWDAAVSVPSSDQHLQIGLAVVIDRDRRAVIDRRS
jgi:hypothetical protein